MIGRFSKQKKDANQLTFFCFVSGVNEFHIMVLKIVIFLATISSTTDIWAQSTDLSTACHCSLVSSARIACLCMNRYIPITILRGGGNVDDFKPPAHSRKLGPLQMTWGLADPIEKEWRKEIFSELAGEDEADDGNEEAIFQKFLKTGVFNPKTTTQPRIRAAGSKDEATRVAAVGLVRDMRRRERQALHKKLLDQDEAKERAAGQREAPASNTPQAVESSAPISDEAPRIQTKKVRQPQSARSGKHPPACVRLSARRCSSQARVHERDSVTMHSFESPPHNNFDALQVKTRRSHAYAQLRGRVQHAAETTGDFLPPQTKTGSHVAHRIPAVPTSDALEKFSE